jgi:hypothetical protein
MLFPTAWLARQTRVTGFWFDYLTPEWVHIVAHTVIFAGLAVMVLSLFRRSHWLIYAGTLLLALFVGILQESIQLAAAGLLPGPDELFDIGVDLTGALCGMSLVAVKRMISVVIWPVNNRVSRRQSGHV